jgi:hypothetical protein
MAETTLEPLAAINLAPGTYTICQLSSGRFLDAYQDDGHDFRLVTREAQHNDTQRWLLARA